MELTDTSFRVRSAVEAQQIVAMLADRLDRFERQATMVLLLDEGRWCLDGFVVMPSLALTEVVETTASRLQPGDAIMLVSNRTGEVPADRPDDELVWEELVGAAAAHDVALVDWWVLWGTKAFSVAEFAPTPARYDPEDEECECCRLEAEHRLADSRAFYAEHLMTVRRHIEEHGFMIQAVLGSDDRPPWAYTIGFLELGHPEVIVFGLDAESAAGALHQLHREIIEGRRRLVGVEHEQTLADGDDGVRLLPVSPATWTDTDHFAVANSYYGALGWEPEQLHAVQLVWAAPGGHFPWDDACPDRFRQLQPILDPETRG